MGKTKKTAQELVTHYPGVFSRRQEIILALCRGGVVGLGVTAKQIGDSIVTIANTIIEETAQ